MSNRTNELEINVNELDYCVLIVKHPLAETLHPWWPAGMFHVGIPAFDKDGLPVGVCNSLYEFVSNRLEYSLFHNGECLLMGVGHIDDFPDCPVALFKNYGSIELEDLA